MKIGVLGLGAMGRPMSANLARAGHDVVGWNRTRLSAPEGVALVDTPAELARMSDVAVVMVNDSSAVRPVIFGPTGWVDGARPGDVIVQSSTIGPRETRNIADDLVQRGFRLVDAPVSGSVGPAEAGELIFLVGGDKQLVDGLQEIFTPLAKSVVWFGPVGTGSSVKLVVNSVLVATMAAAGEALSWLTDAEPDVALDDVASALERISPLVARRIKALTREPPTGQFAMRHVLKDLALILENMAPAQVLQSVDDAARAAVVAGWADSDVSAFGMVARARREQGT